MTQHPLLGLFLALVVSAVLLPACSSSHSPGEDAGGLPDEGLREDAGPYVPSCAPMAARIDPCAVAVCAPVTAAFWVAFDRYLTVIGGSVLPGGPLSFVTAHDLLHVHHQLRC